MSLIGRLTNLGKGVLRSHLSPEEDPPLHLADEPLKPRRRKEQDPIAPVGGGVEVRPPEEPMARTLGERPAPKAGAEPSPKGNAGGEPAPVKRTL